MELPLFPLTTVLFPGSHLPLHIFEERYKQMIGRCIADRTPFGVCLIRQGTEAGPAAEPFEMGTTAHIRQVQTLDEGRLNVTCLGGQRFRIAEITERVPYLIAEVEHVELPVEAGELVANLTQAAGDLFAEYVRLNLAMTNQWARSVETPADPQALADYVAGRLGIDPLAKQRLLAVATMSCRRDRAPDAVSPPAADARHGGAGLALAGFSVGNWRRPRRDSVTRADCPAQSASLADDKGWYFRSG
jgi:Lon protease-like protein